MAEGASLDHFKWGRHKKFADNFPEIFRTSNNTKVMKFSKLPTSANKNGSPNVPKTFPTSTAVNVPTSKTNPQFADEKLLLTGRGGGETQPY